MNNPSVFTWRIHPAKNKPMRAMAVVLFVILLMVIIVTSTHNIFFSMVLFTFLFLELRKFFFPTFYFFDSDKITEKNISIKIEKPWSHFRAIYWDKNGLLLSPFTKPTRLENYRGTYIIGLKRESEISKYIEEKIKTNVKV